MYMQREKRTLTSKWAVLFYALFCTKFYSYTKCVQGMKKRWKNKMEEKWIGYFLFLSQTFVSRKMEDSVVCVCVNCFMYAYDDCHTLVFYFYLKCLYIFSSFVGYFDFLSFFLSFFLTAYLDYVFMCTIL